MTPTDRHHFSRAHEAGDAGLFQHTSGTSYVHLLREVLLTYRQMLRQLTHETGLSGAQFDVLRELALAGGRSTGSALARELDSDPAAVSRLVASLEQLGMVTRASDAHDARRRPVVLTDEGRRLMLAFHARVHECEATLGATLDPQSVETAMDVLHTLRETLAATSRPRRSSALQGRRSP